MVSRNEQTRVIDSGRTHIQRGPDVSMPVRYLKGVGPARAEVFARLGVHTVGDLLEYYPRSWVFLPRVVKIGQARPGENAAVIGLVESTDYQSFRRQPI